jgi:hypothetical protein
MPQNRHVWFDEQGRETGRLPRAQATAPVLDSTFTSPENRRPFVGLTPDGIAARAAFTPWISTNIIQANSLSESDHDPFHVPCAGAASCRRSNLGPAIGSSGARFVNPGSPLRQAHSSAKTGTVSILPARATLICSVAGDAAPPLAVIVRHNLDTANHSSTQDILTPSHRRSPGMCSIQARSRSAAAGMYWMAASAPGINLRR